MRLLTGDVILKNLKSEMSRHITVMSPIETVS